MRDVRLVRHVAANYLAKLWGIVSVYAFVPLYIDLLGMDAYGVIAFQTVVLAIVWIADSGISPAFAREAARRQDIDSLRDLLKTTERIYLGICVLCAVAVAAASGWIAGRWLKAPEGLPITTLQTAIVLMGVGVACQLAMSLYFGGLMGRHHQTTANAMQVAFGVARSALVLLPLSVSPTLVTFFAWQAAVGLLFVALFRWTLWASLPGRSVAVFRWSSLHGVHGFAVGMFAMAVIGALNTQIDKLVTSSLFLLGDYSVYAIAALIGQAPTLLTVPIALALLPRMTALVERRDPTSVERLFLAGSKAIALVAGATGILAILHAHSWLLIWTQDAELAARAAPVTEVLALGGVLLSLQLMPYHLSLAHGHTATNVRIGAVFLVVMPFLSIQLASRYGLVGAAYAWSIMNAAALLYLAWRLIARFAPGSGRRWVWHETVAPIAAVAVTAIGVDALVRVRLQLGPLASLVVASSIVAAGVLYGLRGVARTAVGSSTAPSTHQHSADASPAACPGRADRNLVVLEAGKDDSEHFEFNRGVLQALRREGWQTHFVALEAMQNRHAGLSSTSSSFRPFWSSWPSRTRTVAGKLFSLVLTATALVRSRRAPLLVLYATPVSHVLLAAAGLWRRQPIAVFLHGEIEFLGRASGKPRRLGERLMVLAMRLAPASVQYLVLVDRAASLLETQFRVAATFCPHPMSPELLGLVVERPTQKVALTALAFFRDDKQLLRRDMYHAFWARMPVNVNGTVCTLPASRYPSSVWDAELLNAIPRTHLNREALEEMLQAASHYLMSPRPGEYSLTASGLACSAAAAGARVVGSDCGFMRCYAKAYPRHFAVWNHHSDSPDAPANLEPLDNLNDVGARISSKLIRDR